MITPQALDAATTANLFNLLRKISTDNTAGS